MTRNYWQIAAGSGSRDYAERFLAFGMAFVGGEPHIATMRQVRAGDIVILKRGLSKIVAAGEVVVRGDSGHRGEGDKPWLHDFDGWQLPAYCFVEWRVPEKSIDTEGLTRTTIQTLPQQKHRDLADATLALPIRPHQNEPGPVQSLNDLQLLEFLIEEGLRPSAADDVTSAIRRIRLLADYYYRNHWEDVREHEARTFLVVPLLLALGWAEQQPKIELPCKNGRVDIACFSSPYVKRRHACALLIETKEFSSGLDQAGSQALRYAADFPSCQVLLITNGYCYKLYRRGLRAEFDQQPSAYLNVLRPTTRYPLDPEKVDGAFEVLRWLLPRSLADANSHDTSGGTNP